MKIGLILTDTLLIYTLTLNKSKQKETNFSQLILLNKETSVNIKSMCYT